MKKYYKNKAKVARKKLRKKTPTFNKEQLAFYNGFHSNTERLGSEWNLCRDQYEEAVKHVRVKGIEFNTKMSLQKIAKYWNSRKIALERTIDEEMVKKFKYQRNEPKTTDKDG